MPRRDRADNKGEIVRRDTARQVLVFREIYGKGFRDCCRRVNSRVVRVGDRFRVELVKAYNNVFS